LIDFYLTSSETFAETLQMINANDIMAGLDSNEKGEEGRLNEMILRVMCINQAIEKLHSEVQQLNYHKSGILKQLTEISSSEKL